MKSTIKNPSMWSYLLHMDGFGSEREAATRAGAKGPLCHGRGKGERLMVIEILEMRGDPGAVEGEGDPSRLAGADGETGRQG